MNVFWTLLVYFLSSRVSERRVSVLPIGAANAEANRSTAENLQPMGRADSSHRWAGRFAGCSDVEKNKTTSHHSHHRVAPRHLFT